MAMIEDLSVNQLRTPANTLINFGTAAPTTGTHGVGDIVFNTNPAGTVALGWQCTVAGTPGTWVAIGYDSIANVTASATEINTLTDAPASMTTTATPATGTCGVQFVFKNAAGSAIGHAIAGEAYFSGSTGLAIAAATSAATLSHGDWLDIVAGKTGHFVTTAAGLLGVTVTAGAGSYYLSFQLPDGKILTSSVLTVN